MKWISCALALLMLSNFGYAQNNEDSLTDLSIVSGSSKLESPGIVIGTIRLKGTLRERYHAVFRKRDTKTNEDKTTITIDTRSKRLFKLQARPDFWDNDDPVYIFAWKRSKGDYHFTNANYISVSNVGVLAKSPKSASLECNSPFSVDYKMITYVGEIEMDTDKQTVFVSSKTERDLSKIKAKFASTKWDGYINKQIFDTNQE